MVVFPDIGHLEFVRLRAHKADVVHQAVHEQPPFELLAEQLLGRAVVDSAHDWCHHPDARAGSQPPLRHLVAHDVGIADARQVDQAGARAQHVPRPRECHVLDQRPVLGLALLALLVHKGVDRAAELGCPRLLLRLQRAVEAPSRGERRRLRRARLDLALLQVQDVVRGAVARREQLAHTRFGRQLIVYGVLVRVSRELLQAALAVDQLERHPRRVPRLIAIGARAALRESTLVAAHVLHEQLKLPQPVGKRHELDARLVHSDKAPSRRRPAHFAERRVEA
mmetsp:Transcript_45469/g.146368  ORF Transcript_45469/g.146368 Transcript_45469/m.146368 type:complete len:281 (-) Transcript_45469:708-1550(-)